MKKGFPTIISFEHNSFLFYVNAFSSVFLLGLYVIGAYKHLDV